MLANHKQNKLFCSWTMQLTKWAGKVPYLLLLKCYRKKFALKILVICLFFKNGPTLASFLFTFSLFKQTKLFWQQISRCPFSIWCQNLNPQPCKRESSPITTRPGLFRLYGDLLVSNYVNLLKMVPFHLLTIFEIS